MVIPREVETIDTIMFCDLLKIEQTRQEWPFLRDRRIDAYKKLAHIYDDPHAQ